MIRIITDSTASIDKLEAKELDIDMVPLYMSIDDKMYKDRLDLTDIEFYDLLKKYMPTTSQPSPMDFLDVFNKYPNDEILCITLSGKLSGTYQSANIAKSMSDNEKIYIIDSENASLGLKNLILKAISMRDNNCDIEDIVVEINRLKSKVVTLGMCDTLENLRRGGRISNVKFLAGSMFNIKPILIIEEGVLQAYPKKIRGKQNAVNMMIKTLNELNYKKDTKILIGYTKEVENAKLLRSKLDGYTEFAYDEKLYELGSVIATHTGENAFIMSFFTE